MLTMTNKANHILLHTSIHAHAQKRTCQRITGQNDQGVYVLVESPQCWKERNGGPLKYEMCFPDPKDMKVKTVLRAASKGVNTVFIGYDSAHTRPFLKLKELLAAEKHVSYLN